MDQSTQPKAAGGLLPAIPALGLAACAVYSLVVALKVAHNPMQLDYEEGNILNAGLRIVHGLTPYPDPHAWPIVLNPYGPVFYLIAAGLIKFFGVSFFPVRVVSIVCALLIGAFLFLLLRRSAASWPTCLGFAAMFLCNSSVRNWMATCRVDWVGLAITLAGLTIFCYYPRRLFVPVLLFSAALLVKVSLLAAPGACALYLILRRDWRQLSRFLIGGALLLGIGFFITQWWSSGHFFFHQFGTHPDAYSLSKYLMLLWWVVRAFPLLAALCVLGVAAGIRANTMSLPVLYFLTAICGAATVGKAGSSSNHLLELNAALCLCAGCGWTFAADWFREHRLQIASNASLAGVYLAILIPFALYQSPFEDSPLCDKVQNFLQAHGNEVLTDNVGALLRAGKPVVVSNPFVFAQLAMHSGWSDAPIVERVRSKQFDVILLEDFAEKYAGPDTRFTPETIGAIKQNYHVAAEFECPRATVAYTPN